MKEALSVIYHGKKGHKNQLMASGPESEISEFRDFVEQHIGPMATELSLLRFMPRETCARYQIDDPDLMAKVERRFPKAPELIFL